MKNDIQLIYSRLNKKYHKKANQGLLNIVPAKVVYQKKSEMTHLKFSKSMK